MVIHCIFNPLFSLVWRDCQHDQGAHQADQWHPDLQGYDHVYYCLQRLQRQGNRFCAKSKLLSYLKVVALMFDSQLIGVYWYENTKENHFYLVVEMW